MSFFSPASERVALDTPWLDSLQSHPIFDSASSSSSSSSSHPLASSSSSGSHVFNLRAICVRHTDLIVAVGKEIRITSLLDVKRASSSSSSSSSLLGTPQKSRTQPPPLPTFRTLATPQIDFPIVGISVNPTGRLLVAYGSHQIAVVILPRATFGKTPAGLVSVKVLSIGPYYHSEHNGPSARIAKTLWHPLGQGGTSLLVATRDGTLREYDVGGDADEPVQVVSLLPEHLQRAVAAQFAKTWSASAHSRRTKTPSRARSRTPAAAAADVSRSTAHADRPASAPVDGELASFCIGWDQHPQTLASLDRHAQTLDENLAPGALAQDDWSPFTIYALLRNGDIYALCPFLPSKLTLTAAAVEKFASFVSTSATALQLDSDSGALEGEELDTFQTQLEQSRIANRLANALSKQSARTVDAAQKELAKGKNANGKRLEPDGISPVATASNISEAAALELDLHDVQVDLTNPWLQGPTALAATRPQHPKAVPQGPFLLTPAPVELSDERESQASDICLTRIVLPAPIDAGVGQLGGLAAAAAEDAVAKDEMSVLSVVGDDGRVDICVALDAVGPFWEQGGDRANKRSLPEGSGRAKSKPGRFALSDSEDEDDHARAGSQRPAGGVAAYGNRYGLPGGADEVDSPLPLPSLLVYETIDLGLDIEQLDNPLRSGAARVAPSFVLDPMYRDKIFVYHAEGVHCLSTTAWAWDLLRVVSGQSTGGDADGGATTLDSVSPSVADELKYFLADKVQSQIAHLVKTVAIPEATNSGAAGGYTIEEAAEEEAGPVSIAGFDLILDAYLGYAALAVTSDGRCIALELHFGAAAAGAAINGVGAAAGGRRLGPGPSSSSTRDGAGAGSPRKYGVAQRGGDDEEPLYLSLLRPEGAFVPPEPLNVPAGMPVQPRLVVGSGSGAGAGSAISGTGPGAALIREAYASLGPSGAANTPLQTITPATLRFLTKALQAFRVEVRDVVRAGNTCQARLDLQFRELHRLLDGLAAARRRYEGFAGPGSSGRSGGGVGGGGGGAALTDSTSVAGRMDRAVARQKALMERLDKLLQRLIDGHLHGAQASEQELAWFAELRGMAEEIGVDPDRVVQDGEGEGAAGVSADAGAGAGPPSGLKADLDKLQHQLKALQPALLEMAKRRTDAQNTTNSSAAGRGSSKLLKSQLQQQQQQRGVYGKKQLRGLEEALSSEADLVKQAKQKISLITRDLGKVSLA
ncbi:hypothetical protein OC835_002315 [Tilletia horrida]|nr:hypothetical protein OC835_002315 [Tilletia horrida]